MAEKDDLGRAGEARAAAHLRALGYTILARNWRCPLGEVDIIARRGRELAVVEVKTRSSLDFGHPLEAVDQEKRRRLWKLAAHWAHTHPEHAQGTALRLHAIGIVGRDPANGVLEHMEDLR